MKMMEISVSDEYLDSVCEWMMEWVQKDDSLTVPQFLQWKGIGYPFFKYFVYRSSKVMNTFEVMKSILCNRWFHKAMYTEDLSPQRAKILFRYLRLYDSHGLDIEQIAREERVAVERKVDLQFAADNYAREKLDGEYQHIYQQNDDKRRGREKS